MRRFFFIIAICLTGRHAIAQDSFPIRGSVKDSKGLILPGATVFLSGTKAISISDKDGKFQLTKITPGSYVLIAKYIGFQPLSIAVDVVNGPVMLDLKLQENTNQLNQVVVTADVNWEAHYQEFKKRFLGTTPNADKCRILNKEVLNFHFDKATHTLTASADEFLKIENAAMGYQISYLLESFEFNTETGILKYQGFPSFQDMKAGSVNQADLWQKNRIAAFEGSANHFMRSLYNQNLYTQGFSVFSSSYDALNPQDENGNDKPIEINPKPVSFDTLLSAGDQSFKVLSFKKSLLIVYTKQKESFNFKNSGYQLKKMTGTSYIPRGQYSLVSLLDNAVSIDANGNFSLPGSLIFKGYMAWQQIAELTPLEYLKTGKD